ncbi:MAG: LysM peptidoglycan-binding domain-containing protein [Clostridia bacterium]|nr:LysM peptidoglycan-binding domain-containing protein [Clostridia bacterium]
MIIYTVKAGDSVYQIAQRYGVSTNDIVTINQLSNPDRLAVGQALIVPVNYFYHTVVAGESLYSISRKYGVPLEEIVAENPSVTNPSRIYPGQNIKIPGERPKLRTIEVNGYAFPNISEMALTESLPSLTYLSIFSYQVREDGSLVPINDTRLINAAKGNAVGPFMVITNIGESGGFDSELASSVLNSSAVQDLLLDNVISVMQNKGYIGLDIDFEYVYPSDRIQYNNFVEKTVNRLRTMGYIITTALAPKVSENQVGLLYEAHDYEAHGRLVDHVILMTYEWGYTFGPPMAVAPIDQVERVLRYAVSVIPSQKILMGMPNYGYDWTLPYQQGSRATVVSNLQAVNLAINNGAQIRFDAKSQAPYFYYYDSSGRRHVVWFDDARSVEARLKLIEKYNLGGASFWTINRLFRTNWVVLNSLYNVKKMG